MTGVFRDEERRSVRFLPKQLEAEVSGHTLELSFWLPKGSFATVLFNELGNLQEAHARVCSMSVVKVVLLETLGDLGYQRRFCA